MSKAHYLAPDLAAAGAVVKIEQHDLLPGAERQLAVGHRDGEAGLHKRGPDVGVAVAVAPAAVVFIRDVPGEEPFEGRPQVVHHPGFIFDGGSAAVEPEINRCTTPWARPVSRTADCIWGVRSSMSVPAVVSISRKKVSAVNMSNKGNFTKNLCQYIYK